MWLDNMQYILPHKKEKEKKELSSSSIDCVQITYIINFALHIKNRMAGLSW